MFAILGLLGIGFLGAVVFGGSEATSENEHLEDDHPLKSVSDLEPNIDEIPSLITQVAVEITDDLSQSSEQLEELAEFPREIELAFDELGLSPELLSERTLIYGSSDDDVIDGTAGQLNATRDHLLGLDGNDTLVGGMGDVLVGGEGHDQFEVGEGNQVYILDYEQDEVIVVSYNGETPDISGDATDGGISILANGLPIIQLEGTYEFDLDNIVMLKR